MRHFQPPHLAEVFLQWALPPGISGRSIKGDLDQEFCERWATKSRGSHAGWYAFEAFKLGSRFLLQKVLPKPTRVGQGGRAPKRNGPLERVREELGLSLRLLLRSPWLTGFAVVAMGLGIGVTATMFSFTHCILQDLPYDKPDELVNISWDERSTGHEKLRLTMGEFSMLRDRQSTLEGLAAYSNTVADVADDQGEPERVDAAQLSANVFPSLGVQPFLGRAFLPNEEEPGTQGVALLSHALWQRRYGEDPEILGRVIRLNGIERTVVGVMPEGFHFPEWEDIWVPLEVVGTAETGAGPRNLQAFGRMKAGVDFSQAEAEFGTLAGQLALESPGDYEDLTFRFRSYETYVIGEEAAPILTGLMAVISFVLLIACASVANLLLARAAKRSRELAVQTALGATRGRIIGQVLAESLVISSLGGVLGVGLAFLGSALMRRGLEAEPIPFSWMAIEVDPMVLTFTLGLVFISSLLAGVVPGVRASRVNVNEVLKDEGRGSTGLRMGRLSRALVVSEVGLSCALLIIAGLMAKAPLEWSQANPGFEKEGMFTGGITLRSAQYPESADVLQFQTDLLDRLNAIPGVTQGEFASHLPGKSGAFRRFHHQGVAYERNQDLPSARWMAVGTGFFETLGVSLSAGRPFSEADNLEAPGVIIVNQSFAERHFPDGNALGRQLRVGDLDTEVPWKTVVGVAPDLTMAGPPSVEGSGIYIPLRQEPQRRINLLLRTAGDPLALTPSVRQAVADLDEDIPVYGVNTLAREIIRDMTAEFVLSGLLIIGGATALVLAAIGLFGIMAFTVQARTREIGIRIALGAESGKVLWGTLKSGLFQVGLGMALGMALAVLMASVLGELFQQTDPLDKTVWGSVILLLALVGFVASWVPALRAVRTDPVTALRYE